MLHHIQKGSRRLTEKENQSSSVLENPLLLPKIKQQKMRPTCQPSIRLQRCTGQVASSPQGRDDQHPTLTLNAGGITQRGQEGSDL